MRFQLAQLNIAQLLAPLDSPQLADFVANLDRINALADNSPGFVWRLQTETGNATDIEFFGPEYIVNMSVWQDFDALHRYVYRSAHTEILRRKREWFHTMRASHMVLWWVPEGHQPSMDEAGEKLKLLREQGPSPDAFTFKQSFPAPNSK